MNRQKLLLLTIGLLGIIWLGVWVHGWWGTITLDYENKPLGTVLRSFTKQSGLTVVTDLDEAKPITIHVIRVPVAEAMDALQAVAESRGRLLYLAAPNNTELQKAISLLPGKLEAADWKTIEYRLPFMFLGGSEDLPRWGDPRQQTWNPTPPKDNTLVSFFENAAQATDIRIILPASWNPKIEKSVSSGPIASTLPSLTHKAGGTGKMVYLLPGPRPDRSPDSGSSDRSSSSDSWRRRSSEGPQLSPEAFATRLQSRLSGLSTDQAKEAQASMDESVKQYKEWLTLTPEEQEKKMQEIMQDPNRQQRGSDRFTRGMRMMSPQQRAQRYSRYNNRKETVKDPGHTR
ncbi:MAG: hypothetical protein EBU36_05585 [Verrucomicrobia bacterium]|jgi:hypothetical protein|nr:hypothetical protein [Verrucomicrobiota bacterium]